MIAVVCYCMVLVDVVWCFLFLLCDAVCRRSLLAFAVRCYLLSFVVVGCWLFVEVSCMYVAASGCLNVFVLCRCYVLLSVVCR